MAKPTSVVSLDPIDRKKKKGVFARLLVTRFFGGQKVSKDPPFGHYMFCGAQGTGKTSSALWYATMLKKQYEKPSKYMKFKYFKFFKNGPYSVEIYSNFGVGIPIIKDKIPQTVWGFNPYENIVRILLIDEIHTYFPKDNMDKETKAMAKSLINLFSQLRKRNTFILSTAQIYGRLDKSLREQCLFMINCKVRNGKLINDFIPQEDIIADDLGRWAGNPKFIYSHGLSKLDYDTKKVIIN